MIEKARVTLPPVDDETQALIDAEQARLDAARGGREEDPSRPLSEGELARVSEVARTIVGMTAAERLTLATVMRTLQTV